MTDVLRMLEGAARELGPLGFTVGPDAWTHGALLATGDGITDVVIVQDRTVILRDGSDLKQQVATSVQQARVRVTVVILDEDEPHTTPHHIGAVRGRLREGMAVVALGSGTVVDITKAAVHEWEAEHGSHLPLISMQTANSVCAYTSSMSVVSFDGVKRTLPSRLPDQLVLDTVTLADAPREYTLGGIGDASVAAVSFADYRLSHLLGMGDWVAESWELMRPTREGFLQQDPSLGSPGLAQAERLSLDLSACGLAMSEAGESAPLSGLEHITSHMLDMAAPADRRPVGNHGSQCALATILSLIVYARVLDSDEPPRPDLSALDLDAERELVRATFSPVSTDEKVWQECWRDYEHKLATWHQHQDDVEQALSHWAALQGDLRQFTVDPATFVAALTAAGHPVAFEEIPTDLTPDRVRWAFINARLMRKRTTIADLLAFSGWWTDEFIDEVFSTFHTLSTSP